MIQEINANTFMGTEKKRTNDLKNVVDAALIREDDRLPGCLLTADEFHHYLEIAEACKKSAANNNQRPQSAKLRITNPVHPFHALYEYLEEISKKFEGTEYEHHCLLCGKPLPENETYPYCVSCGRSVYKGQRKGCLSTRGYRNQGRPCVVCGRIPVMAGGMCRACYRLGDRRGTHNPEDIKVIRQSLKKYKTQCRTDKDIARIEKFITSETGSLNVPGSEEMDSYLSRAGLQRHKIWDI